MDVTFQVLIPGNATLAYRLDSQTNEDGFYGSVAINPDQFKDVYNDITPIPSSNVPTLFNIVP